MFSYGSPQTSLYSVFKNAESVAAIIKRNLNGGVKFVQIKLFQVEGALSAVAELVDLSGKTKRFN